MDRPDSSGGNRGVMTPKEALVHHGVKGMTWGVRKDAGREGESEDVDSVLQHFGIPGMKWGVRKADKPPASADSQKSEAIKGLAKVGKVKALSNTQLMEAINRMNLEQSYKRLAVNDKPAITRWISSTLLEIGKKEVQNLAAKRIAGFVAKKVATAGAG